MNKRILLVEDNTVSREFLHEALKPLAISIDIADSLASASLLAEAHRHSLFLCDVHLPDGGPREIYECLKLVQDRTPQVAITAEANPTVSASLQEIGYREVWGKPITIAALQRNVARVMDIPFNIVTLDEDIALWDQASALRAVGSNLATLAALRKMFLDELPKQIVLIKLAQNNGDTTSVKSECHKLLASCGFVGAARLATTVKQLSENSANRELLSDLMKQAEQCLAAN